MGTPYEPTIIPWQQKINSMCIGVSGCDGVGKAALVEQLKDFTQLPHVPDGIKGYLENRKLIKNTMGNHQILKMYLSVLSEKKTIERAATKFIAEGTTLDYVSYILAKMSDDMSLDMQLNDFMVACGMHAVETYDLIFLMPFRRLSRGEDAFRSVVHMLTTQGAMEAQQVCLVYSVQETELSDQVVECLGVIDKVNEVKLKVNSEMTGLPVKEGVVQ